MKKLKSFYRNNRIYCILMIISIFCFILMGTSIVTYFVSQVTSSKYGHRLDNVKKVKIDKTMDEVEKYFKSSSQVKEVKVSLKGKIIYINVTVEDKMTNEDVQNLANNSLEKFDEKELERYDIQFLFQRKDIAPYLGSKTPAKPSISWANYNIEIEEETTTSTTKKKK